MSSSTTTVTETRTASGMIRTIVERANADPRARAGLLLWGGGIVVYNVSGSFVIAKETMDRYRNKCDKAQDKYDAQTEYDLVMRTCKNEWLSIFWESLWWPWTLTATLIPRTVLFFNKRK